MDTHLTQTDLGSPMSVDDVIALEKRIEADGTPLLELMKSAGAALAETAQKHAHEGDSIVVFAGNGNNGGDGWVAARLIADNLKNSDVTLIVAKEADDLTAEPAHTAATECMVAIHAGRPLSVLCLPALSEIGELLNNADLVIDAILGTGFSHEEVREPFAQWIQLINEAHDKACFVVIAADTPSGLNARTGKPTPTTIQADTTVMMLAAKTGLMEESAKPYTGTLLLAPLGMQ